MLTILNGINGISFVTRNAFLAYVCGAERCSPFTSLYYHTTESLIHRSCELCLSPTQWNRPMAHGVASAIHFLLWNEYTYVCIHIYVCVYIFIPTSNLCVCVYINIKQMNHCN